MTKIVVIDMDGTLCNSAHREHLARAGQWDEFHSLLMEDQPWPDVQLLIEHLDSWDTLVVGLTGRNQRYHNQTINWLAEHDIGLDALLMRPDDDYRSDHELKPELLDEYLAATGRTASDVWFILEDRDKVVAAWRDKGFNCWQPRAGGY